MATWAGAARAEAAPAARPRPRPRPVRRAAPHRRVAGGVLWIGALAALLAGVVAMNVGVLRLNMALDGLGRERADLRAGNAALSSQVSSAAAARRIQSFAARRFGLVQASPAQTSYVLLDR